MLHLAIALLNSFHRSDRPTRIKCDRAQAPQLSQDLARSPTIESTINPCPKTLAMPVISMFYGVIIRMYYFDNQKHQCPHIHVSYQDDEAVFAIPNGDLLEGQLQRSKLKLVQAWIEIHQDELMANWQLAVNGQQVFKINPLQ